jgi:hypothetical protein
MLWIGQKSVSKFRAEASFPFWLAKNSTILLLIIRMITGHFSRAQSITRLSLPGWLLDNPPDTC